MEQKIGKIVHTFDKIGVVIISLSGELKVGDSVHILGKKTDFTQKATSLQVEHQALEKVGKGQEVGFKLIEGQTAREGDEVYLVRE